MPDDSPATKADLNALEQRVTPPLLWALNELRQYLYERTRDAKGTTARIPQL
jgi:hypothetical protein